MNAEVNQYPGIFRYAAARIGAVVMGAALAMNVLVPAHSAAETNDLQPQPASVDCSGLDLADMAVRLPRHIHVPLGLAAVPEDMDIVTPPPTYCPTRQGKLAFVYVPDTTPLPGKPEPTLQEVTEAAQDAVDLLRGATDGDVAFTADVIEAPKSVTNEVRSHMNRASGTPCINQNGRYTPSKVALRQMYKQLRGYRAIVAIGGVSCGIEYKQDGKTVTSTAAGTSYGNTRRIDIFPVGWFRHNPLTVSKLAMTEEHELGHELGELGHKSALVCPEDIKMFDPSSIFDLDSELQKNLTSKACNYTEYSSKGDFLNVMGESRPHIAKFVRAKEFGEDPVATGLTLRPQDKILDTKAFAKSTLTALQADVMSERVPGMPNARTADLDLEPTSTLVDRYKDGKKPYGAIMQLESPLLYAADSKSEPFPYTQVALDYRAYDHFGSIDIYLTNTDLDGMLRLVHVRTVVVSNDDQKIVKIAGRNVVIQNDTPRQVNIRASLPSESDMYNPGLALAVSGR